MLNSSSNNNNNGGLLQVHVDRSQLLPGGKVIYEFMVSHIEQLVIKQLTVDEDGIYFIPD